MKSKPDWFYLRPALIVMTVALLFSISIKLLGIYYYQGVLTKYEQQNVLYQETNATLTEVREAQDIIATYGERFDELERSGLFDGKERVKWVDAVNSARREMKLPLVRYELSAQVPFIPTYLPGDEFVSAVSSTIKLEAGLLHEGDIIDLFGWMERYAPGQLHLSQCELVRSEATFGYFTENPNMNVTCYFNWITLLPAEGVTIDG